MGVFTFTEENTSPISPAKLFKALVEDGDTLIPEVVDAIQSIETIEGNGGPGTIKKITFTEDGKLYTGKHKIDAVDKENFVYDYTVYENENFPETLEKISIQTKLSPGSPSGSIVKVTINYVTKGDAKPTEEELKIGKEKAEGLFKAIESHLDLGQSFL